MSDTKQIQIDRLSKALEVSQQTILRLEQQIKDAALLISLYENEKKLARRTKMQQEQIIRQQITSADGKVKELQQEIMELRAKLKQAA